MNKKLSAIVDHATEQSTKLIEAIPASNLLRRSNSERIAVLRKEFVSCRPVIDPVSPRICELGAIRYGRFPKSQTLLNAYGPLLRVWREAIQKLVSASAQMPTKGSNGLAISEADLNRLDFRTKARVIEAIAALREAKLENDRLKVIIREGIPAPGHAPQAPEGLQIATADRRTIMAWLSLLDTGNGGLEISPVGLRVSKLSRPGTLVMHSDVLSALRAVAAATGIADGTAIRTLLLEVGGKKA